MCLLNPKVDLAFKKLFGSEENKDLLKSLVNSIMPPEEQIEDLELKNPYNLADYIDGKLSILDIKAVDAKGRWYDIEMQVEPLGYYGQKALFYWGKVFTGQIESGELYSNLKKTIVISIMDFIYFPNDRRYHRMVVPLDTDTKEQYDTLDFMALHFVELKKFKKELKEITTALDRWATFLNNAYKYEKNKIPAELLKDKAVKKAIEKLDVMYLSEKEREYYEAAQKAMRDSAEALRTAKEKGKEEGRKEEKIEIARQLKQEGIAIGIIENSTGLSKEEIEKL
jgi:predicted transposase/invertase (TIGR01784 family)